MNEVFSLSVTYSLSNDQKKRLFEIREKLQKRFFVKMSVEDLFQHLMLVGSSFSVDQALSSYERLLKVPLDHIDIGSERIEKTIPVLYDDCEPSSPCCPSCLATLDGDYNGVPFCPFCGQVLSWEKR